MIKWDDFQEAAEFLDIYKIYLGIKGQIMGWETNRAALRLCRGTPPLNQYSLDGVVLSFCPSSERETRPWGAR